MNIFNEKIFFGALVASTVVSTVTTAVLVVSTLMVDVIVVAS